MKLIKYTILLFTFMAVFPSAFAQKETRQLIRKGNKAYEDSIFRDAEIAYRKAIDSSPKEEQAIAHFNLGNTLINQNKAKEAIKEFETATKFSSDNKQLAEIYHNMGVAFQGEKKYKEAIESYKKALIKNPKDDETRYNLALLLKNQQNQDKKDQEKKDKDKKDQDKKDQNKKNQDQKEQDKKDQQQQQKNKQEISKDAAEKLLEAVLRDEKKTQEKVQKRQVLRGKEKMEKEW